jgi:signal transduction histidine kinase
VAQFAPDRSLAFCNQPFRRMFAMKNEWLADRPEFDRVLDRMREANRLPEVRDFPAWKAERRDWFTAPDAVEETWSVAGTHLRVVAQPLPEGGLLLIFEDRTQQFELQREHGEMQQVRTATLESLAEAVAVFGKGRLQLWNRKFRQVWDFEDKFLDEHPQIASLVKKVGPKLTNPSRAEVLGDLIRLAAKDRQTRGSTVAFTDGRHFDVTAVPLPDGNALMTMLDTTDHHRAEQALRDRNEALEAADRVKTSFVANMSYELRTPLTSIKGFTEMLHGGFTGDLSESGAEYTGAILASVERLGNLIDDVLDLTQSEGAPLGREAVDLELTAASAAEAIAPLAKERRIELVIENAGTAGSVTGDPRRLRQVIEHLLRHAVGGTGEGGRVLLHLDGNAKVARVIVSDDGPGMPPEAVARAFDRFARPNARNSERALGLGLPIAKQFVEAHGGRIELMSEPGEGTLVTVELPRS